MPVTSFEDYIAKHPTWKEELIQLRELAISTELEEAIKWGAPVYTLGGKNIMGLGAFKNHCALWFFNGALLQKNTALLINAQEGKTRALRQIRFTKENKLPLGALSKYIAEAIQLQKEGKEIKAVRNKKVVIPQELLQAFEKDIALKKAFKKLSQSCQREYAEYITEAKREATKQRRLEKICPMIKLQKGLHDKYKR